jgi:hypothetical protein
MFRKITHVWVDYCEEDVPASLLPPFLPFKTLEPLFEPLLGSPNLLPIVLDPLDPLSELPDPLPT